MDTNLIFDSLINDTFDIRGGRSDKVLNIVCLVCKDVPAKGGTKDVELSQQNKNSRVHSLYEITTRAAAVTPRLVLN